MEEKFEFTFASGTVIKIVLGEDGYNVNIYGVDKPLMGTFTDFENLLKGIALVIQENVANQFEFGMFVSHLYFSFKEQDNEVERLKDEIGEILMG